MTVAPTTICRVVPQAVEQRPGGVHRMGQRVEVRQGLEPVGRERHRQQDPRQQEQRQGEALDDRRERVLALDHERQRVRQERERQADEGDA